MPFYEFEGRRPKVHPQAWVAPSADVIGDVTLDELAYVGWEAVLRGDHGTIRVGWGAAVEEGVIIHTGEGFTCSIGEQATIGHGAMLHNAIIEDLAVIGMRATVSNFSRVGRWSIIGEMGLVPAHKEIPAEAIAVGHPVKVVGRVEERHKERWLAGKKRYQAFAKRNQTGLLELSRGAVSR